MDGFGIVNSNLEVKRFYATSLSNFKQSGVEPELFFEKESGVKKSYTGYAEFYDDILSYGLTGEKLSSFNILHHRKATSGSKSLENVHPFEGERYIVMQNGTSKEFVGWGEVEGMDLYKPDSYYLSQWIERKNSFDEIKESFAKIKFEYGTVVIVDKHYKTVMMVMDGNRSMWIDLDSDGNIISFSSLTEEGGDEYKNVGTIIFDFSGGVIENGITKFNEKKVYHKPAEYIKKDTKDKNDSYYSSRGGWKWDGSEWKFNCDINDYRDEYFSSDKDYTWSVKENKWKIKQYTSPDEIIEIFNTQPRLPAYDSPIYTDDYVQSYMSNYDDGDDFIDNPDYSDIPDDDVSLYEEIEELLEMLPIVESNNDS